MSKVLSYKMGDFIRKKYDDKIEKPKDIGMILKPRRREERKLRPEDIFDDIKKVNKNKNKKEKQNENKK